MHIAVSEPDKSYHLSRRIHHALEYVNTNLPCPSGFPPYSVCFMLPTSVLDVRQQGCSLAGYHVPV